MIRYITFLRAINVGGQKLIKMEALARIFTSAGFKNVRTFIQSGNVIFDSRSGNAAALGKKIKRTLRHAITNHVLRHLRPSALQSLPPVPAQTGRAPNIQAGRSRRLQLPHNQFAQRPR